MTIDTTKLRELAQNATPGPWTQWEGHGWVMAGTPEANEKGYMAGTDGQVCSTDCADFAAAQEIKNAEYIAAANPATVLALLDELDRLTQRNAELRELTESAAKMLASINIALGRMHAVDFGEQQLSEIAKLRTIEAAARNLVKVKGRHNSEIAMNKLLESLK